MSLKEIIDLIRQDGGSWLIIFVIATSLVEITPIKVNPISSIFKALGKMFNKDISDRLDNLENKLDNHIEKSTERDNNLEIKLDSHIQDSILEHIRTRRETILDFGNSCMNGRRHTKEEFDFIISECDKYEKYCEDNNIPNGVAETAISEIRRIYTKCIRDNSFLREGEDYENKK